MDEKIDKEIIVNKINEYERLRVKLDQSYFVERHAIDEILRVLEDILKSTTVP